MKNVTGSSDEPVTLLEELGAAALLELVMEPVVGDSAVVAVVPVTVVALSEVEPESDSTAVAEELVAVDDAVVVGMVVLERRLVVSKVAEVIAVLERSVEADTVVELAAVISAGCITAELVEVGSDLDVVLFVVAAAASVVVEGAEGVVRLGSVEAVELLAAVVIIQQSVVVAGAEVLFGPVPLVVEDEASKNTWAIVSVRVYMVDSDSDFDELTSDLIVGTIHDPRNVHFDTPMGELKVPSEDLCEEVS